MELFKENEPTIHEESYEFTLYKTYFLSESLPPKKERLKLTSFVSGKEEELYHFLSKFGVNFQEVNADVLKLGAVYLEVRIETDKKIESKYFLAIDNFRMEEILNDVQKKGENT